MDRPTAERFPHPHVTSNLATPSKKADHVRAGGSIERACEKARKSFIVKILTRKPLGLKILQRIFANPAPVGAFRGVGEGGYIRKRLNFPKRSSSKLHPLSFIFKFFSIPIPKSSRSF